MSSVLDLAPLSPKTLGETEKLPMNYEGSYKPARVGLQRALQSGQMRNPLQMRGSKHEDMTYLCTVTLSPRHFDVTDGFVGTLKFQQPPPQNDDIFSHSQVNRTAVGPCDVP